MAKFNWWTWTESQGYAGDIVGWPASNSQTAAITDVSSNFITALQADNSYWLSLNLKINLRKRIVAHTFATDWLHKQKFKRYETGHFSGNSRPDKAGNYYPHSIAGNDTERHCRQLSHYPSIGFKTPSHTYLMRTGKTGTTRQGNLLLTWNWKNESCLQVHLVSLPAMQ